MVEAVLGLYKSPFKKSFVLRVFCQKHICIMIVFIHVVIAFGFVCKFIWIRLFSSISEGLCHVVNFEFTEWE